MKDLYLIPIQTAVVTFPIIALLFTLPYMIYQYRKFERIPILKVLVTYSFIFYMITAYYLVILPLPSIESVAASTQSEHVILEPLESMRDYIEKSNLNISDKRQVLTILSSAPALQLIFNVLLVLPFGMYLRYYFRRNWWQTLIMSFELSLFFELTQLTGLYWIYPKPYRFFELDDLICNTLGGMIGFWIAPVLHTFLPRRAELDKKALRRTAQVSVMRRILATLIDWVLILIPAGLVWYTVEQRLALLFLPMDMMGLMVCGCALLYEIIFLTATRGYTPGKRLFRLRIMHTEGYRASFWQFLFRSILLYGLIFPAPILIFFVLGRVSSWPEPWQYAAGAGLAVLSILYLMYLVETVLKLFGAQQPYRYDAVCNTCCTSVTRSGRQVRRRRILPASASHNASEPVAESGRGESEESKEAV